MKTISKTTLPNNCFIFEKQHYRSYGGTLPQLPYVKLEYEGILKAYSIPYRKSVNFIRLHSDETAEVCEYWNPEVFEEKQLSLPLFAKMPDGSYQYCEKNYTATVPTKDTVIAAMKTEEFVKAEISAYNQILREVSHYYFAKEKLAGGVSKVCISLNTPYKHIYDIDMNHDHFKILRVDGFMFFTDWVAIFDMNKIAGHPCINLFVPKHIAGAIIGKDGTNIKKWATEIGVKKIQVVPL